MIIKSAKNLCNNYNSFSELAHSTGEPIFITANGEGDLVLLSIEAYEKMQRVTELVTKTQMQIKESDYMTTHLLGHVLREMYNTSLRGQQVTNIHTFAIYYAKIIEENKINKKEILHIAGLPESYQTELSKGINLAAFVDVKPEQVNRIRSIEENFI